MRSWLLFLICSFFAGIQINVSAQVVPDKTLPQNSAITADDSNTIDISGGTVAGKNLFHSFEQFSVLNGETAFFNNALTIENIISRVTGSSVSNIDGLIRANGTANLFLINPNGIVFGSNAALDIGGSFIGSTANSVNFADGSKFGTVNPNSETLLTISIPLGLQYGNDVGNIAVNGAGNNLNINPDFTVNRSDRPSGLAVNSGKTLALIGGNVALTGGNLTAAGGKVEIGSLESGELVTLNPDSLGWNFSYEGVTQFRDISLSQAASIEVSGNGGGSVRLQGRNISILDGSAILADTLGTEAGDLLTIAATDTVRVIGTSESNFFVSRLSADVDVGATGNGGDLSIESDRLTIADGGQINSSVFGKGNGGNLSVTANEIEIVGESASTGFASGLFAQPDVGQTGDGGSSIVKTNYLLVADGGQISTTTFGTGNGGDLSISADVLELVGFSANSPSNILASTEAAGNGGTLNITTNSLLVTDGGQISTTTFSTGNAGNLNISAQNIELLGGSRFGSSGIFTNLEETSSGNSRNVNIETDSLFVGGGAQIASIVSGTGDASILTITADSINLEGTSPRGTPSAIFSIILPNSQTIESGNVGSSSNLIIDTNSLAIAEGAQIATSTISSRDAGNLIVRAKESIDIRGTFLNGSSGLFANALSADGSGGNLTVITDLLNLQDGATISVSNFPSNNNSALIGEGAAGNLSIIANKILLDEEATLTAETFTGDRGNISLQTDLLLLRNSSRISTNAQEQASGGNITIDASNGFVIASPQENSDITANAIFGDGGRVDIDALEIIGIQPRFSLTSLSDITASSQFGIVGNVVLNTQDLSIERNSIKLPNKLTVPNLLQGCQGSEIDSNSRFINIGRGGLRPQPREVLSSHDFIDDISIPSPWLEGKNTTENSSFVRPNDKIIEATRLAIDRQGQVKLIADGLSSNSSRKSLCP